MRRTCRLTIVSMGRGFDRTWPSSYLLLRMHPALYQLDLLDKVADTRSLNWCNVLNYITLIVFTRLVFARIVGGGHSAGHLLLAVAVQLAELSTRRARVGVAAAGAPVRESLVVILTRAARRGRLACARCRQSPPGATRTAHFWRRTGAHKGAIRANGELFVVWFTLAFSDVLRFVCLQTDWIACAREFGIQLPASIYPITSSGSAIWRNVSND